MLEELEELRKELEGANAVSMQNYKIDKQIRALAEKNRLHDALHRQTAHQIDRMNDWLQKLLLTDDAGRKRALLQRIVVVGAYLKRRNNLTLVGEQDGRIDPEELELSIREMMKNMQLAGVNCACTVQLDTALPVDTALRLFDFYEYVVEKAFDGLSFLLARFFRREGSFYVCVDAMCGLDLTKLRSEHVSVSQSEENCYTLSFKVEGGAGK